MDKGKESLTGDGVKLLNRLSRIEGQVRGISRMIEQDRYCIDVLTQIQAARAALTKVETELLRRHIGKCVETALTGDNPKEQRDKVDELIQLLLRSTC